MNLIDYDVLKLIKNQSNCILISCYGLLWSAFSISIYIVPPFICHPETLMKMCKPRAYKQLFTVGLYNHQLLVQQPTFSWCTPVTVCSCLQVYAWWEEKASCLEITAEHHWNTSAASGCCHQWNDRVRVTTRWHQLWHGFLVCQKYWHECQLDNHCGPH